VSYAAIQAVRESDIGPAGLRLVALILADAANSGANDGSGIRLSLRSIANRCAMSEDQASRHVRALLAQSVLILERQSRGPKDPNSYRLDLAALQARQCSWAAADADRRERLKPGLGGMDAGGMDTGGTRAGGIGDGVASSRHSQTLRQRGVTSC
jgi:AraC-like DNA-binding protein